jgi:hypothetical protein
MSVVAPLRVPVEIRRGAPRWFRMAHEVSEQGLAFPRPLPEEADGPLEVAFQLPGDALPIRCAARAIELDPEEGAEHASGAELRRAVRFVGLAEVDRARIAAYVEERVPE